MTKERPLSWSALSSFTYSPEQWYSKYILNEPVIETVEMKFGKVFATSCELRKPLAPVTLLSKMEQKFEVVFEGIPLIGYADTFCHKTKKKLGEYKTGKRAWNQKRVDEHGQLTMYALMNFITNKVLPEDCEFFLEWIPTQDTGAFGIEFIQPIKVHPFKTKRTTADILRFGKFIKDTKKAMHNYVMERNKKTIEVI